MAADTDASPPYGDQPTETMRWIGQYQVIREIGHGAEGIVHQARDPAIGRDVAIKELRLSRLPLDEIPEARQRFVREAQAVGNLRHENIVTLYQFIEQRDALYLVMEFVPGGALRPKLIGTASEALVIVRQVAAALDHAHANGIVHRDIKPGNILVSGDPANNRPVMKVADFGIARFLTRTMTLTGVSMGTPAYMAPEQIQGYRVDARADQFSLAVLACELLSGRLPFTAPSYQALTFQIVNAEPASLREANPWLPPEVDLVIRRALAKNPDDRFPSCGAFGDALEQVLAPTGPATQRTVPAKSGTNKKFLAIVAGALLAVAVGAGALYFRQPALDPHPAPASATIKPGNLPVEKAAEPPAVEKAPEEPATPVSVSTAAVENTPTAAIAKPSFDCTKAKTPTEKLVCSNADLAALEVQMVTVHDEILSRLPKGPPRNDFRQTHLKWFKLYTRTCNALTGLDAAMHECVYQNLSQRLAQLRSQAQELEAAQPR